MKQSLEDEACSIILLLRNLLFDRPWREVEGAIQEANKFLQEHGNASK